MKKIYCFLMLVAGVLLSWQELDAAVLGSGPVKSKYDESRSQRNESTILRNDLEDEAKIGATQQRPDSTIDVGVVAILNPIVEPMIGSINEVKIAIQNFGMTMASAFDVAYSINGFELNANVITRPVPAGDTIHHTFSLAWTRDIIGGGPITICAFTKVLGSDANPSNDTTCAVLITGNVKDNLPILGKVYPNPANDEVYFELQSPADNNTRLVLLDPVGKVVQRVKLDADQKLVRIELNSLAPGMYSYRLERQSEVGHGKLMIVK